MKRILVTGSGGEVGGVVLAALEGRGLPVRAGSTHPELLEKKGGREVVRLDFTDARTWPLALMGCDGLFLLVPSAVSDMELTLLPFLDTARAAGVEQVVFLSVAGVEQRGWTPHRAVERHLEAGEGGYTILRAAPFAQNLERAYARDVLEDGRLYLPGGEGQVAYLDAGDVGPVVAALFGARRRATLTLAGPQALSFSEVADKLGRAIGRPVAYRPASLLGFGWHLVNRRALSLQQVALQAVLHLGLRQGGAVAPDPELAGLLGRELTSFDAYLARRPLSGEWVSGPVPHGSAA